MQNKFKLIAVLCFILLNALFVCGQKKIITSSEYYSAYSAASQKQYDVSRRVETVTETYADGVVSSKKNTLSETILPNKSRYVVKEQKGDTITERESITIDNFLYKRENGGAWTKIDLSKMNGMGSGSGSGGSCISRQITVEQSFLNNFSAKLYEMIDISESNLGLRYKEEKSWISDEGFLLKNETSNGLLIPKVETSKTVTTYEYNPTDLKIEAPIK
ncbi:MAG TPA: hypothetical protein PKY59_15330 [Pyrinomonadaceae bacterium]|nr:hypothetical protein [Pyrinomonadaceae bacterium]